MVFAKRIFLFLAVNMLVVLTLSILLSVLGVRPYLNARGLDYGSLAVFCLIWGMGGAFISLALSRGMAKWAMGVKLIDSGNADPRLLELVEIVYRLAKQAGLTTMPEVGVYNSAEVNAFATGPTKARSLVAVSAGLLQRMNRSEMEGVLGHEVSHIANGDMVTMTLLQGIMNAFVMFLARVIAFAIAQTGRGRDDNRGFSFGSYFIVQFLLEIVLMILGSIVIARFSRHREFRANHGGATLAGKQKMISALQALQKTRDLIDKTAQPALQTLKISTRRSGFLQLFSTHPSLEVRIQKLEQLA